MNYHVAYTAGLIDGEGSILLIKTGRWRRPGVSASSTTLEILEYLKSHWGGTIVNHKTYKEHHKQSWYWQLRGDKAIDFLKEVGPCLLEPKKRHRAEHIVLHYKKVTPRNGKYSPEQLEAKKAFEHEFYHPSTA